MPNPVVNEELSDSPPNSLWMWLSDREYRRLVAALPMMAAVLLVVAAVGLRVGWKPAHTEARLVSVAASALGSRSYHTAKLAYWELLQLRADAPPEYRFRLALSLLGLKQERPAMALLKSLAPNHKAVYAPAHLFLASDFLASTDPAALAEAEKQLALAASLEPRNAETHRRLGLLYQHEGKLEQARRHLMEAAATRGEAMLPLAAVLRSQGDEAAARNWLERAQRFYKDRVASGAQEGGDPTLGMVEAMKELGDYAGAISVLVKAAQARPDLAYLRAVGEVSAQWAKAQEQENPDDVGARLKTTLQGLQVAPQNLDLLSQITTLTALGGSEAGTVQQQLQRMLIRGENPPLVHLCVGLQKDASGDHAAARAHFSLAFELDPSLVTLANNLALNLTFNPKPDAARALRILDSAVAASPKDDRLRTSRGQILLHEGRYADAVRDLEASFSLLPADQQVPALAGLIRAHERLGNTEAAASFRARVASLTNQVQTAPQ